MVADGIMCEYQWPSDWPPGIKRFCNRQYGVRRQQECRTTLLSCCVQDNNKRHKTD
jgi:hypothetical protein